MRAEHIAPESGAYARQSFIREVRAHAALPSHVSVEAAAQEVVAALSERLTPGGAHLLLNALPESLGRLFQDSIERHKGAPSSLDRSLLLDRTAEHFGVSPAHAELICRAVIHAIRAQLAKDVATHVAAQLPHDLKDLWYSEPPPPSEPTTPEEIAAAVFDEIQALADLPPTLDASSAFTAVMCTFAQRLSGGEARHVAMALPQTLRPLVTACMLHRDEVAEPFHRDEFLKRVSAHLHIPLPASETVVRAVFSAVRRYLPSKDIEDVASQLPPDLYRLWRGPSVGEELQ